MKKTVSKVIDKYLDRPILWDLIITCGLVIAYYFSAYKPRLLIMEFDINIVTSILSDVMNTAISLAGFVLAALTIVVTFKDNLIHRSKSVEQEPSGMELLFNSKHYKTIVGVFSWAALVLIIIFLAFSIVKLLSQNIVLEVLLVITISGIILLTLTIFRTLLVLFGVIRTQIGSKEMSNNGYF